MSLETANGFSIGDLVFVGSPAPLDQKVIWRVTSIYQAADDKIYAVLTSGMTERGSTVPIERLTHYRPRLTEPAAA